MCSIFVCHTSRMQFQTLDQIVYVAKVHFAYLVRSNIDFPTFTCFLRCMFRDFLGLLLVPISMSKPHEYDE